MRSHTDPVVSLAIDSMRKHMATVSNDHTIRVWDLDTLQQLYDFSAPQECPCAVSYHPSQQVFACGFENGCVRVFNVATTSMLAEHKQHRGKITGLAFSPSGEYLYSSCSLGSVALYDASENVYGLLRLLGNTIARGEKFGPDAIAVAPEGRRIAFIGPTEFTISVLDARTLDEVLRIDITSLNPADNTRTIIDTAVRVHYAPTHTRHLLVATSSNSLLKFDARTGRLLSEMNNIHRSGCTSLDVIRDGRHLVTAGDRVIKVWDYHMRLDLNFQVFIGHTEKISKVVFTPDSLGVVSIGEAIFLWDFMANKREVETLEGRTPVKSYIRREDAEREEVQFKSPVRRSLNMSLTDMPRRSPPKPARYDPKISEVSALHKTTNGDVGFDEPDEDQEEVLFGPQLQEKAGDTETTDTESVAEIVGHETLGHSPQVQPHQRYKSPAKHRATVSSRSLRKSAGVTAHPPPAVHKHFKPRPKTCQLAQRRYVAPPNQAGLQLMSVLGYNGNGRDNMIWQPDTGFFAYTCGCIIVVEDLSQSTQRHLIGHTEEISTLALQNDCQVLASASGGAGLTQSQICLWDLQQMVCHKVLSHHEQEVVCMAYSRDDRFLISVGDYRECSVVVWDTKTYAVLTTSHTSLPIHQLTFDPYTMNEFVTVGQNGSVLFWLLDETGADVVLNVHEAEVPEEVLQTHHMGSGQVDFTAACYGGDSTLYITTNNGKVTAWDTRHNSCFMHFETDGTEIGAVVCRSGRLVTGSVGHNLRLWSVVGIGELKLPGSHYTMRQEGLTMEDEMNLDGPISCAAFDDTLDMGIVGTETGTLWYINWTERTSIRLVTGHMTKVNGLAFANDDLFATCGDDGSLRMWSVHDREQTLQFQVMEQACTCLCFAPPRSDQSTRTTVSNLGTSAPVVSHSREPSKLLLPHVAAGYSDGTVRMFDLNKVELILKMHPHAVTVTAINFSSDGRMLLSGGSDGLIAVSSPTTGMTVRVISDHKGAPITNIDVTLKEDSNFGISAPSLWLATSADRRVSVWSADWTKDFCELVDWLTFPAPGFTPDGTVLKKGDENSYSLLPPSLARFSLDEPDIIVYTGYGMQKLVHFYSMAQRKVVRTAALTHWASSMDLSPTGSLVGLAVNERLVKLMDYFEGSFQDFVGHSDAVHLVRFSPNGSLLFSIAYGELIVWRVTL
ncbi:WD repeat-containing protein 90-like [Lingula anatina]|uniref:WD repeat-containing protein 90-like n=1 Tax=Lingula anatina TaxID=7574 RepID=A0A1S3I475_LINAN|nr:WD repeat-containing protein 90-like [Lingula anatina]|eukprot:XP_013393033.1 WD repeat-containing protein 90-like [Lingula anatina]